MSTKERSFFRRHIIGMCLATAALIAAGITNIIYAALRGPVEAIIATNQVNDSVTDFVLHQQVSYNNLLPTAFWILGGILAILFLLPTIIEGVKLTFTKGV